MYVNCVMPFNSNSGLKRALHEKSIYDTDRFAIQLKPDGQLGLFSFFFFKMKIPPEQRGPDE